MTPAITSYEDLPQKFVKAGLGGLEEDMPLAKAALTVFYQHWPQAINLAELVPQATLLLSPGHYQFTESQQHLLEEVLLKCYLGGVIEAFTSPLRLVSEVSTYPVASELARWQIQQGHQVATLRCEQLELGSPLLRIMLPYLDGQHDQAALVEVLRELVTREGISVYHEGQLVMPEVLTAEKWEKLLGDLLKHLARLALLVG